MGASQATAVNGVHLSSARLHPTVTGTLADLACVTPGQISIIPCDGRLVLAEPCRIQGGSVQWSCTIRLSQLKVSNIRYLSGTAWGETNKLTKNQPLSALMLNPGSRRPWSHDMMWPWAQWKRCWVAIAAVTQGLKRKCWNKHKSSIFLGTVQGCSDHRVHEFQLAVPVISTHFTVPPTVQCAFVLMRVAHGESHTVWTGGLSLMGGPGGMERHSGCSSTSTHTQSVVTPKLLNLLDWTLTRNRQQNITETITKLSTILSTWPIYLGKCNCNTILAQMFWLNFS